MDESAKNLGVKKEVIWRTWFRELGGNYWTIPEAMPESARDPWNNYCHYRNNPSPNSVVNRDKAAEEFKMATGFDAKEVYRFKLSLK